MSENSNEFSQDVRRAVEQHEGGDWQGAETVYRRVLEQRPENPEVLHLIGMARFKAGDLPEAANHIWRAIKLDGSKAFYHSNLAAVLHAQGDFPAAEQACRQAAALAPQSYDAWNNLGGLLIELGKRIEAEEALRTAIEIQPQAPQAHINLGNLLMTQSDWSGAIASFEIALQADAEDTDTRFHLGVAFLGQGAPERAVESFRLCFPAREQDPHAHYNLGMALLKTNQFASAIEALERCLELKPEYPDAHCMLGICYLKFHRREEAEICFKSAIRGKPLLALAYNGLALVEHARGNRAQEMRLTKRAIEIEPSCAPAHLNLACQYLLQGDLERGWQEYRWIRRCPGVSAARFREGCWNGEPLEGKTLVICAEQGYGDVIQFIRYAALAKERGAGKILLQCSKPLRRLMARAPYIDEVLLSEDPLPADAAVVPVLDLPRIFATTLETIPSSTRYLRSSVKINETLRKSIKSARGRKIGLAWRGNPEHSDDDTRSMPWRHLLALKNTPGVIFFSFQKGHGCEEVAELAKELPLVDAGAKIKDFAEAARAMQEMDLVISVDTSTIHLAGSLGIPAWLLLPYVPEWRWLLDRNDSPWYPSLRIFRQKKLGDWDGVMDEVTQALS